MTVAIVGASGQLGRCILSALLERGVEPGRVVAAVRTPARLADEAARGVHVRRADYDEPASLESAFEGVERALLLPTFARPAERVRQYENAIAAATGAGVRHLVHAGLVPTTVESPFAVTPFLLYAESALRTCGLDWTILRNGLYADPIVDWVPAILEMGTIPYPTGEGRCAYVARDDLARATAAVLATHGHEGATYALTGPEALTTAELCAALERATGESVSDGHATDADYLAASARSGDSEEMARVLLSLYHAIRDGHLDVTSDDVERLTGRPPARFEDLVRASLARSD